MFRWNKAGIVRAAIATGAFAAFVIGSGAGWYWY
jgi:hypothetical protein